MNTPPDVMRLTHLKLDGFAPGATVLFCPQCDFQYFFECAAVPICPRCDVSLHATRVTPELVKRVRAA